jgi:hypothetical protein
MRLGLGLGLTGSSALNAAGNPNLLSRPIEFDNATWIKGSDLSVTANSLTAPNGTTTAELLTINSSGGGIYQVVTVTPSTTYTFSLYVRLGTLAAADFKMAFRNDTAGAFIASDVVPAQTPDSSGWVRAIYTVAVPSGCTSLRVYAFRNALVATGTFYLWGAKLELGPVATTFRP